MQSYERGIRCHTKHTFYGLPLLRFAFGLREGRRVGRCRRGVECHSGRWRFPPLLMKKARRMGGLFSISHPKAGELEPLRFDLLMAKPIPKKPSNNIAQVEGSGTAEGTSIVQVP